MTQEELNNTFTAFQSITIRNASKSPQVIVKCCTIDGELLKVEIPLRKISNDIYISESQLTFKF